MTWPCWCFTCVPPLDPCYHCGVSPGQICRPDCSEHPANRAPCPRVVDYPERIARGDS